jgi:hypothetical protein
MSSREIIRLLKSKGLSGKQARAVLNFTRLISKLADDGVRPYTLDIVKVRMECAEQGVELTPQEIHDILEVIDAALEQELDRRDGS